MNNWMTMTEAEKRLNLAHKKIELWRNIALAGIVGDAALLVALWISEGIWAYVTVGLVVAQFAFYFLVVVRRGTYWENEAARMYKILYGDSE